MDCFGNYKSGQQEVNNMNTNVTNQKYVSTSNQRAKIIATENTELTEDFFSVSSVLSVADNVNTDSYKFYYPTF
jgi:hypothetical protein